MPSQIDTMTLYQGEDTTLTATITKQDGTPEDLTGLAGDEITYYLGKAGSEQAVVKIQGGGITITNATGGEIQIDLTAANLSRKAGRYRHEVWISKGGARRLAVYGDVQLADTLEVIG